MTNVPYNTNTPFASNSPSQDQPKMQENTNSIKSLIEIDHVGFGNNQGGYHTVIHQATQSNVNTVLGINQIFSGIPGTLIVDGVTTPAIPNNGDVQLYSLTGNNPTGGLSQLTGNSSSNNGFQWIGGVLLQWGIENISIDSSGKVSITFPEVFPSNIYNISLTLRGSFGLPAAASILVNTAFNPITTTGFDVLSSITGTNVYVYWTAIGN